jgi:hypothetical protein
MVTAPDPATAAIKAAVAAGKVVYGDKRLLAKFVSQPSVAATALSQALAEFRKSVESIRDAMLALWLLANEEKNDALLVDSLKRIADGQIYADAVVAKGRCRRIGQIYDTYLKGWFSDIMSPKKQEAFAFVFATLRHSDNAVVRGIEAISFEGQAVARQLLDTPASRSSEEVRVALKRFEKEYRPKIRQLNSLLAKMLEFEDAFYRVAKLA